MKPTPHPSLDKEGNYNKGDCYNGIRKMIEFELKFKISKSPSVLDSYDLLEEMVEEDFYYDTKNYSLIKNGNFLRVRNNKKLDFKLDLGDDLHLCCNETRFGLDSINSENSDFKNVFKALNIDIENKFKDFNSFVDVNNFKVIAPIIKKRKIYKINDDLEVTIDEALGLGMFLEAEMMFEDSFVVEDKTVLRDKLIQDLKKRKIINDDFEMVKVGYVELYLMDNNKEVYEIGKFKA